MTQWYVKDLSSLTGVSVQTLHHYDRIDLLKPSVRLSNGYRVYSEKDLLQLQRIIALKFFGFELSQIKVLLTNTQDALEHFIVQAQILEKKANTLMDASKALQKIIHEVEKDGKIPIPWETVLKTIEVYNMTRELEHSWVKEIFTPEELKEYAAFEAEWKHNATPNQKADFEKNWGSLIEDLNNNLKNDPKSKIGISIGERCMTLINGVYGKKYAHLRTKKFEKGFGEGKGLDEVGLTSESVLWLDKAIDTYWRDRILNLFDKIGKIPSEDVLKLWYEVLDEMYGDAEDRKQVIYDAALADDAVSPAAKAWLSSIRPS